MKGKPRVKYKYDDSISKEDVERRLEKAYDILFDEVIKTMEKSSDPDDIALLKEFQHLKE
jgi:hypothetical protein